MKKTFLMVFTVSLISFASCTDNEILPEEMLIELDTKQDCCEGENDPPPPPPPPPPGGGVGGGG